MNYYVDDEEDSLSEDSFKGYESDDSEEALFMHGGNNDVDERNKKIERFFGTHNYKILLLQIFHEDYLKKIIDNTGYVEDSFKIFNEMKEKRMKMFVENEQHMSHEENYYFFVGNFFNLFYGRDVSIYESQDKLIKFLKNLLDGEHFVEKLKEIQTELNGHVKDKNIEQLKKKLKHPLSGFIINTLSFGEENNQTLLIYAVSQEDNAKIIKELLKNPYIDPNVEKEEGTTALTLAIENKKFEIVKMLLESNSVYLKYSSEEKLGSNYNQEDLKRLNPLYLAYKSYVNLLNENDKEPKQKAVQIFDLLIESPKMTLSMIDDTLLIAIAEQENNNSDSASKKARRNELIEKLTKKSQEKREEIKKTQTQKGQIIQQGQSEQLNENDINIQKIVGDGNCQFSSLAYLELLHEDNVAYPDNQDVIKQRQTEIRGQIIEYMRRQDFIEYIKQFGYIGVNSGHVSIDAYIQKMSHDKEWGDDVTLLAYSFMNSRVIVIYRKTPNNQYEYSYTFVPPNDTPQEKEFHLLYNNNHYDALKDKPPN